MSKVREDGWYWVKIYGEWECAEYDGVCWNIVLSAESVENSELDAIGPRIEKPEGLDDE